MHPREHIRRHASSHHEAHLRLKELLRYAPLKEKLGGTFLGAFTLALISLVIYANWGVILGVLTIESPILPTAVHGFKTGVVALLKVEKQVANEYRNLIASLPTDGSELGAKTTSLIASKPKAFPPLDLTQSVRKAVRASTELGTGQTFTSLRYKRARGLQKSVLAAYYLGKKGIDFSSEFQRDTHLLGQINNALAVDLFEYLNQSASRADSLEAYLKLLETLSQKTDERLQALNSAIAFMNGNLNAEEARRNISEEEFLKNLKILNGPDAERQLQEFVGAGTEAVELRARLRATEKLRDYYAFFRPKLENLITAVRINRDPMIAGVKVVEIENMTLPLIIRQQ